MMFARHLLGALSLALVLMTGKAAFAQSWVQVEALPGANAAIRRAEFYAGRLPDVNAFRMRSGWHAIVLGPYGEQEARGKLLELRGQRLVPSDSFISDGRVFRDQIFGSGRQSATLQPVQPTEPAEPETPLVAGEETPAEARASERQLDRDGRALLQTALKFEGFYNSVIDAAFGPGTRRAMSAWQEANGYEPTGVLTTLQRRELVDGYNSVLTSLNMQPVVDPQAGIELDLPTGLVEFDRHESPFAHYNSATDDGVKVLLISQSGDFATLGALYDILQTLEIVPTEGERNLGRDSFTINAENDEILSYSTARIAGDAVKGFSLIWPKGDERRFRIALASMRESFRTSSAVLPDNLGSSIQDIDLLAGLEIRRPIKTRTGFYVSSDGLVLTTREAVNACGRVTLSDEISAETIAEDAGLGLALLRPSQTLAPVSIAALSVTEPRIQSDVAIAGFSFGGVLSAPSLTYATVADIKGLDGDNRVQRLDVTSEPGDAGGPVFDSAGVVTGMLLDPKDLGRTLPADVAFAADAPVLTQFLADNGVTPLASDPGAPIAPEDLTALAADMAVLVSCWN